MLQLRARGVELRRLPWHVYLAEAPCATAAVGAARIASAGELLIRPCWP